MGVQLPSESEFFRRIPSGELKSLREWLGAGPPGYRAPASHLPPELTLEVEACQNAGDFGSALAVMYNFGRVVKPADDRIIPGTMMDVMALLPESIRFPQPLRFHKSSINATLFLIPRLQAREILRGIEDWLETTNLADLKISAGLIFLYGQADIVRPALEYLVDALDIPPGCDSVLLLIR